MFTSLFFIALTHKHTHQNKIIADNVEKQQWTVNTKLGKLVQATQYGSLIETSTYNIKSELIDTIVC